jgi:hypothetical protein
LLRKAIFHQRDDSQLPLSVSALLKISPSQVILNLESLPKIIAKIMSKNILIIALLVILIISLGLTALYITQRQEVGKVGEQPVATLSKPSKGTLSQIPSPSASAISPLDTSNWKTFEGKRWSWMIKYPPEPLVSLEKSFSPSIEDPSEDLLQLRCEPRILTESPRTPCLYEFSGARYAWSRASSSWVFVGDCKPPPPAENEIRTEHEIGGVHFVRTENHYWMDRSNPLSRLVSYISYQGNYNYVCYLFHFTRFLGEEETFDEAIERLDEEIKLFDQIVSTFQVTKEIDE